MASPGDGRRGVVDEDRSEDAREVPSEVSRRGQGERVGWSSPSTSRHGLSSSIFEERGYGIVTTSARIDEAAEAYEALVEDIVVAAEIETTMRRLIEEIEKVKRRVNALEYRVIPELKSTEAFIRQRLEEMERDNFMRLKRFKAT